MGVDMVCQNVINQQGVWQFAFIEIHFNDELTIASKPNKAIPSIHL